MTIVTTRIQRRRLSFVSLSSEVSEGAWLGSRFDNRWPRRNLLRGGQARPVAGLRARQRDRGMATDRYRARGAPVVRDARLARSAHRCIPGQCHHGWFGRVLSRHRDRQHPRSTAGGVSRQPVRGWPLCVRGSAKRCAVRDPRGAGQSGGERDVRGHEPLRDRLRGVGRLRADLAHVCPPGIADVRSNSRYSPRPSCLPS